MEYFYSLAWNEVYDLVEFIVENLRNIDQNNRWSKEKLELVFNKIFEKELSGYRFISGQLAPISNAVEVTSLEEAIEVTFEKGLYGANTHITTAIELLAKRPNPDYRNSIKESISAVESIAKQIGTNNSQGLSDALDALSKKIPLHGALRSAFVKLYGYTSNEHGIRHAMLDEPDIGYNEAKYMAVVCSAFVNYLATKAEAHGLYNEES